MRSAALIGLLVACTMLTPGCAVLPRPAEDPAHIVRGPLPARIQQPVALTLLTFLPRRAAVQGKGQTQVRVDTAYSSFYEVDSNRLPEEGIRFDGEISRTSFAVRYGVTESADLEVVVPLVYTTSGWLDSLVDSFHDAFGFPDGGRSSAEDDQWDVRLVLDGQRAWEMEEDRLGFGDLPVVYTMALKDEEQDGWGLAARVGVELPTGSEDRGFGNGGLDYGGGFVAERSVGRWTFTGGTDYVFTETPSSLDRADGELLDIFDAQAGVEMRWGDRSSLLAGLVWMSPMSRDFHAEEFDSAILDLGVGMAWTLRGGSRLAVSFHEDLIAASGPDFTAYVVWSMDL